MDTTTITVRIHLPLATKFDSEIKGCFIRRDAFLNQVLRNEAPQLRRDLSDKRLSAAANAYISRRLKETETKPVNIVLERAVATAFNEAVEEANVVRDAFMNFLFLCLRAPSKFLNYFELPVRYAGSAFSSSLEQTAVSPLQAISEAMADPFYYLRTAVEERYETGLYALEMPEQLHGFSVYLPDTSVPGTPANREQRRVAEELIAELDQLETAAFTKKEPS